MARFGTWLRPKPPIRPLSSISLFIPFGGDGWLLCQPFSCPVAAAKLGIEKLLQEKSESGSIGSARY